MKQKLTQHTPLITTVIWIIGAFAAQYKGIAIQDFILLSLYAGIFYLVLWGIQALTTQKNNAPHDNEVIILEDNTWRKTITDNRLQLTDTIDAEYSIWSE